MLVFGPDVVGHVGPGALYVCTHTRTPNGLRLCTCEDLLSQYKGRYDKLLATIGAFWLKPPDDMPEEANRWVRRVMSEFACDDLFDVGLDTLPRVLLEHAHLALCPRKLPHNFDEVVYSMAHGRYYVNYSTGLIQSTLPNNDVHTSLIKLRRLALMPEMICFTTIGEDVANLEFALEITRAPECLLVREQAQSAFAAYCMLAFGILQKNIRRDRMLENACERSNQLKDAYERFNSFAKVVWCMAIWHIPLTTECAGVLTLLGRSTRAQTRHTGARATSSSDPRHRLVIPTR